MHAPNDRRRTSYRTEPKLGIGFLILTGVAPLVLLALAILQPKASVWISQAAQAEFAGDGFCSLCTRQAARPDMAVPVQTVRVY